MCTINVGFVATVGVSQNSHTCVSKCNGSGDYFKSSMGIGMMTCPVESKASFERKSNDPHEQWRGTNRQLHQHLMRPCHTTERVPANVQERTSVGTAFCVQFVVAHFPVVMNSLSVQPFNDGSFPSGHT